MRHETVTSTLIALGSNQTSPIGDPIATINDAIAAMQTAGVLIQAKSRLYRTPSFPEGSGPEFINAVVRANVGGGAPELLCLLHDLEERYQRRRHSRWAARTLDLDLIDFGGMTYPDRMTWKFWRDLTVVKQQSRAPETLILPHPRVQDRAFVLVPLSEVAPLWRHPTSGNTVLQMLDALPARDLAEVKPL